jgi:RNA polymerase sigma-70 factor (ECF subfamily)
MELRLEASAAERALGELPEDQRLAVALVLIDGLSYREASEILDVPMGTLTSRLVRGRTALLARLEGAEV